MRAPILRKHYLLGSWASLLGYGHQKSPALFSVKSGFPSVLILVFYQRKIYQLLCGFVRAPDIPTVHYSGMIGTVFSSKLHKTQH